MEATARFADESLRAALQAIDFAEIAIVLSAVVEPGDDTVEVAKTAREKCGRCWRHLPEVPEDGALCARCDEVVNG